MELRKKVLDWLIRFTQAFGPSLRDTEGKPLCRAFPLWWKGKLHLLGLPNYVHLRPVPLAEEHLAYWRQTISWEQAGPPDFPRLKKATSVVNDPVVCHVIICHLPPVQTQAVVERWRTAEPDGIQLLAYGGTRENFDRLPSDLNAIYIAGDSLRTSNHARERQQYSDVFKAASHWLAQNDVPATHVHIVEFDVVPVVEHPGRLLVESLHEEDADVLGFGLVDLTGTTHPHYRHEMSGAKLLEYLNGASVRELRTRLITMLGCSSIWTRACFDEVAQLVTPRVYLEVAMPTLAHHLGYRVRPMPETQQRFVTFQGDYTSRIEEYRQEGAWLVHPCKGYWNELSESRIHGSSTTQELPKQRLLLIGHTYGAAVNRAKAAALSRWYDVMVCSPDFEGIDFMGRDGSLQDFEIPDAPYQYRCLRRWPRRNGFTTCIARGLRKVFEEWQPEIVLCEAEPWAVLRWQSRLLSWLQSTRPLFIEFTWENLPRPGFKGKALKGIYRLAALTSDGVVCGNKGAENLFVQAGLNSTHILRTGQLGVAPEEHPVASVEEKELWRRTLGLPPESFVIGFCGRLVEEKGIWDLLTAATRLREKDGVNCSLVFLGAGALSDSLKAKIAGQSWARVLSPVPHIEVPDIISKFDLFVLPSKAQLDPAKGIWEEQFGHVLIEAMMCGVPSIGSDSGGIPEVIDQHGATFPAGDVDALHALLAYFVSEPTRAYELAHLQREQTLKRWTHEALAERYVAFMNRLKVEE